MAGHTNSRREQLISAEQLQALVARRNAPAAIRLLQHVLLLIIAATISYYTDGVMSVVFWLVYAVTLIFSFCPLHESIHGSLFATHSANSVIGFLLGLIIFLPPRYFFAFHMAHHRYTQIPAKDPELAVSKPSTVRGYVWHVSGIPYALAEFKVIARGCMGKTDSFVPEPLKRAVVNEARIFALIYLTLLGLAAVSGSMILWWYWVLPLLVAQPFLRWFLLAEHTGCDEVADMLINTRTTLTNKIASWFFWQMNHHTAHHAYAGVPFFRLPEVTGQLLEKIAVQGRGYVRVNLEIVRKLDNFQ